MEKWVIRNKKGEIEALAKKLDITNVTAKLLCNRGLYEETEIKKYLFPEYTDLNSPFLMRGMDKACEIIREALEKNEKIRIIGDYDVDGVSATYVLTDGLKKLGANVDFRIPDRVKDGYGINESIVREAAEEGVALLVTCDNGIRAVDEIKLAKELGMKVVLTDHHDIPETVPEADVVINPKYAKCRYPYTELCGAVVALKLIEALNCKEDEDRNVEIFKHYIDVVSIATVCDVVELKEENRAIVKLGLEKFKNASDEVNEGLRTLMREANVEPANMDTYAMGFVIGPCINASGRLDTAVRGLELLSTSDKDKAHTLAMELISLNNERKELTKAAVDEAEMLIAAENGLENRVLVILLEKCHESIAGIVAGRIRERYDRPTIVLTAAREGIKGSARSIEAYNITEELDKCSDLLSHYGGHAMAAGMSLARENFEAFKKRLNDNCTLTPADMDRKVSIDLVMPTRFATERLCQEIDLLAPFGSGNPAPLFAERNVEIVSAQPIGKEKQFLRLKCKNENGDNTDFTYFGSRAEFEKAILDCYGQEAVADLYRPSSTKARISLTYIPEINEYNGYRNVQFKMKNYLI